MKIQVLIGMIASGKSTYARRAAAAGHLVVNDDALVTMLHGGDYTLYDPKLKVLYKSLENQAIGLALAVGRTVVVDRGLNVSPRGRKRWLALAESFDVPCEAVYFPNEGPRVHATRRVDGDARGHDFAYWLRVAQVHNAQWVLPSIEEGFTDIRRLTYDQLQDASLAL